MSCELCDREAVVCDADGLGFCQRCAVALAAWRDAIGIESEVGQQRVVRGLIVWPLTRIRVGRVAPSRSMKVATAELVGGLLDGERHAITEAVPELRFGIWPSSTLWQIPPAELSDPAPLVYRRRELEPDAHGLIHYDYQEEQA